MGKIIKIYSYHRHGIEVSLPTSHKVLLMAVIDDSSLIWIEQENSKDVKKEDFVFKSVKELENIDNGEHVVSFFREEDDRYTAFVEHLYRFNKEDYKGKDEPMARESDDVYEY